MAWELNVKHELRPCYICGKRKALFHGWDFVSGTNAYTRAIVELEDGHVTTVMSESIQFLDTNFDDYCWDEKGE